MFIWNANIIFSRMSIIFFSDAGNVIFKCIYQEKVIFSSFDGRIISCLLEKKYHLYIIYRKHHISMYFLRKIIFHFPSTEKISYFCEKEMYLSWWYKKDHMPVRFFWKNHLFRTVEENIIFPCIFLGKIIFHFPSKE